MVYTIKNDDLTLQFDELGAELISIHNNKTNIEYLWNADPEYWKRHSPILFPFVGSLRNKSYQYKGISYPMTQHGFARDMLFHMISKKENEIWFSLEANEDTLKVYPFLFRLDVGYLLSEKKVTVKWKVLNQGNSMMYFSIGGHPAFNCPICTDETQSDYFLLFDTEKPIRYLHINEEGLVYKTPQILQNTLSADYGILPINPLMFDYDALIIEDSQCHKISIMTPDRIAYLSVSFDSPLVGLWTPAGKNAPFVCIEPWYGRCDAEHFNGDLEQREWGNSLQAGEIFEVSYTIEIV